MFRTKNKIDVYCGWSRETIVRCKTRIVRDIAFEIPCLECDGTGVWDYFPEEIPARKCNACKGTGKQYVGI